MTDYTSNRKGNSKPYSNSSIASEPSSFKGFGYNVPMSVRLKRYVPWALLVFAGLSVLPAYMRLYVLRGASDIPTVLLGDKVVVNNAAYKVKIPSSNITVFRSGLPKRGDFVLLRLGNHLRLKGGFFKRVLGLPGETIEMRENRVIVNGRALPVRALNPADFDWVPKAHPIGSVVQDEDGHWITFTPRKSEHQNYPPIRLSDGQYFVLGDNRDNSEDSREFGPVSEDLLLGKVIAIFETGERSK